MKAIYYRVIKNGHCRLYGKISDIEKLTGYKINDSEDYEGRQLEDGTLIHPVFYIIKPVITAADKEKCLSYLL